jgi:hypothetical protein
MLLACIICNKSFDVGTVRIYFLLSCSHLTEKRFLPYGEYISYFGYPVFLLLFYFGLFLSVVTMLSISPRVLPLVSNTCRAMNKKVVKLKPANIRKVPDFPNSTTMSGKRLFQFIQRQIIDYINYTNYKIKKLKSAEACEKN